jgi:cytochrome P450
MTWTVYLLSQNPEKEKKLVEEIDAVLQGGKPDESKLKEMKYLRGVLNETLR